MLSIYYINCSKIFECNLKKTTNKYSVLKNSNKN